MATVAQERPWVGRIFVDGEFKEPGAGVFRRSPTRRRARSWRKRGWPPRPTSTARCGRPRRPSPAGRRSATTSVPGCCAASPACSKSAPTRMATLIVRETGGIPGKAQYEVGAAQNELYEAAALASRATAEVLPSHDTGKLSLVQRVPVGVVAAITPWNFPVVLGFRVLAPALALGNTVVLEPAPETPLTGGLLIAELFAEAGAPPGILHALSGDDETGKALVAHPGVNMIDFTGSSAVGREIAIQGAGDFKRVSLELGGNNAFVVLDDADVDAASMVGAWSAFHYMGQTCITAGRHIVARNLFDDYVERMAARAKGIELGDPNTAEVGLGPMISETQVEHAHDLLERSLEMGARWSRAAATTASSTAPPSWST